jgi:hypothetical protein
MARYLVDSEESQVNPDSSPMIRANYLRAQNELESAKDLSSTPEIRQKIHQLTITEKGKEKIPISMGTTPGQRMSSSPSAGPENSMDVEEVDCHRIHSK